MNMRTTLVAISAVLFAGCAQPQLAAVKDIAQDKSSVVSPQHAQVQSKELGLFNTIAISDNSYLSIKADGTVDAYIKDWDGLETHPRLAEILAAVTPPKDLKDVIAVSTSNSHSLALKKNSTVTAWGRDLKYVGLPMPEGIEDLKEVVSISAGRVSTLALTKDGRVFAWGRLGAFPVPEAVGSRAVKSISAGHNFSYVVFDNGTVASFIPGDARIEEGLDHVKSVASGMIITAFNSIFVIRSMALKDDGTVVAFGPKSDPSQTDVSIGTEVPEELSNPKTAHVVALKTGGTITGGFALALKESGEVVSWGGSQEYRESLANVPTADLKNVQAISTYGPYAMAINKNGKVAIWGKSKEDLIYRDVNSFGSL